MEQEKLVGVSVPFERIRRITGYLVGTVDRFNNAKAAEVRDRVKHFRFAPVSEWGTGAKDSEPWA